LLTTLLVDPDEVQSGATTATTVQRMLAELAVLSHNSTGAPPDVLLTPGREWTPDEPLVAALLHALDSSPWSRLVPVSTLIGADASNAARSSLPALAVNPDELAATQVQALADARNSVISFARAIDESSALTDGLDTSVLTPLSVGWRADPARRAALVNQVLTSTSATLAGLSVSGPPNLNVISANAPVRFVIDNRLNVAATVSVQVRPRKGCLRTVTSDPVTVDPQATDTVTVTLQAIANCDVTVDVTLVGAGGTSVGQAVSFAARVAPTVENVGTVVVAIFLVIGLVLGIVRTVRRGRSARRGTRAAPEDIGPLRVLGGGHVFGADTGTAGGTGRAGRPHAAHRTPDSPSVPLPGPIAPPDQPPDPHPVAPPATPPAFPPGEDRP
ncbi:MAG: DUF6049 family protein, partial [Micrococcales bacterium]|nr:DUF6049 family protein [Micrococcales bacterium]